MNYWMTQYFDDVFFNQNGSNWDPVWSYAIVKNNALCISPSINLVKNIGFNGDSSTHGSSDSFSLYGEFENDEFDSLSHPEKLIYNPHIDAIQIQTIVKPTDPVFLVKDFKHYFKKIFILSRYPRYIKKIISNLESKLQ